MSKETETIRKDWQRTPELGELCVHLFEFVSDKNNRQDFFSFGYLKSQLGADEAPLATALQYLCSPRWAVLRQVFIYFGDDGDSHEIPANEMAENYAAKSFAHPITGIVIHDLDEISVVFEIGPYFTSEGGQL